MANYNYFCSKHGEIILNLPLGQAKDKEKCPLCQAEMDRIYSAIANVWKCSGSYNQTR